MHREGLGAVVCQFLQTAGAVMGKRRCSRIWAGILGFGSSEEFASLLANVLGKPFPHQMELLFSGLGPSTLEEGSREKILPCPQLVSAGLKSILKALVPFP